MAERWCHLLRVRFGWLWWWRAEGNGRRWYGVCNVGGARDARGETGVASCGGCSDVGRLGGGVGGREGMM